MTVTGTNDAPVADADTASTTENQQMPPRPTTAEATPPAPTDALEGEPLLHEVIALFDGQIVEHDTPVD